MATPAQRLYDRELLRGELRRQWTTGMLRRVRTRLIASVRQSIGGALLALESSPRGMGADSATQVMAVEKELAQAVKQASDDAYELMIINLEDLAEEEGEELETIGLILLGAAWRAPSARSVIAESKRRTVMGRKLRKWWRQEVELALLAEASSAIRRGVVEGESIRDMVASIMGRGGATEKAARAADGIAATAATHVTNTVRSMTFPKGGRDRWVSVLDDRTTIICIDLDGTTWPTGTPHRWPPAHRRCRSVVSIDLGPISERPTYREWLKTLPEQDQDRILGPTRAKAWRSGELSIKDMVNTAKTRVLTITQLRQAGRIR